MKRNSFVLTLFYILLMSVIFASMITVAFVRAEGSSPIAILKVFADPSEGSINIVGFNAGKHSFITIQNVSNSSGNQGMNITVGAFENVEPGKSVSLGTYGNISEHKGLWYNLEAYRIKNQNEYDNRGSIFMYLNESELKKVNDYIITHDRWTLTYNCAPFVCNLWNLVSPRKLDDGFIGTSAGLGKSIRTYPDWKLNEPVIADYDVYYANGDKPLIRSKTY